MDKRPGDEVLCFICDNPWVAFFLAGLLLLALFRACSSLAPLAFSPTQPPSWTAVIPSAAGGALPPANSTLSVPGSPLSAPSAVSPISPTVSPSVFRMVFISVNWQGNLSSFRSSAQAQAQTFIQESGLQTFLRPEIILSEAAMTNQDLTDPALVDLVQAFALEQGLQADRYIGLTNADLSPQGESSVVGWTNSQNSLVVEVQNAYVTAHEMGHTFGLCDEYNYADWLRQDRSYADGCPNPYPPTCDQSLDSEVLCNGTPAQDGSNSIMGPAGLPGEYSYNRASLEHLQTRFSEMAR